MTQQVFSVHFLSSLKVKMLMKVKSHMVRRASVHGVIDISSSLLLFPVLLFFSVNSYQTKIMPALLLRHMTIYISLLLGDSLNKQLKNENGATFGISVVSSINFKA